MEKLDLTKKYKAYYSAKTKPEIIELPEITYLSIEGKGDPSSSAYTDKIQALYPVAYGIKFACKAIDKDFTVPKLEGLWWFDEKYEGLTFQEIPKRVPRSEWCWRLLIRMPEFVGNDMVMSVIDTVVTKKKVELAKEVSLFTLAEGKVVQMLHVGPFDREPETLQVMAEFMEKYNFQKGGLHHEIYLSDLNKTEPSKLRTILREPVK
jgi:hypothetical protein